MKSLIELCLTIFCLYFLNICVICFLLRMICNKKTIFHHLYFNFVIEYAIRSVQANQEGLKLNGTHQLFVYADDANTLGRSVHTIRRNRGVFIVASKEIILDVNAEKSKYMVMSRDQNVEQNLKHKNRYYVI